MLSTDRQMCVRSVGALARARWGGATGLESGRRL